MEDIVDLPLPRQREPNHEGENDFLNLKGTMVFVVQLLRWLACFDVSAAEHYQISYLVCW